MESYVFLNGNFVPQQDAVIPVQTHALQYGTGCFEGIRAYYSPEDSCLYAFRLADHYKRLLDSGKILFMDIPYTTEQLVEFTSTLLQKNYIDQDIYVRPFLYKSETVIGNFALNTLKSSLCIYTIAPRIHTEGNNGLKAKISSWTRIHDNNIPPKAKISGAYVNTCLAVTEAVQAGYDEAIFLNSNGFVSEGSAENIFIIKDGKVYTPPVYDNILVGITRNTIMEILNNELNIITYERSITRTELYQADEIILVGTGAEISPVIDIDGHKISGGTPGPITSELKRIYGDIVHGKNDKYNKWLTKVTKI